MKRIRKILALASPLAYLWVVTAIPHFLFGLDWENQWYGLPYVVTSLVVGAGLIAIMAIELS